MHHPLLHPRHNAPPPGEQESSPATPPHSPSNPGNTPPHPPGLPPPPPPVFPPVAPQQLLRSINFLWLSLSFPLADKLRLRHSCPRWVQRTKTAPLINFFKRFPPSRARSGWIKSVELCLPVSVETGALSRVLNSLRWAGPPKLLQGLTGMGLSGLRDPSCCPLSETVTRPVRGQLARGHCIFFQHPHIGPGPFPIAPPSVKGRQAAWLTSRGNRHVSFANDFSRFSESFLCFFDSGVMTFLDHEECTPGNTFFLVPRFRARADPFYLSLPPSTSAFFLLLRLPSLLTGAGDCWYFRSFVFVDEIPFPNQLFLLMNPDFMLVKELELAGPVIRSGLPFPPCRPLASSVLTDVTGLCFR